MTGLHKWNTNTLNKQDSHISCTQTGDLCYFPFSYKGKLFHTCTNTDSGRQRWCSLDPIYSSGRWDYCAPCPSRWSEWSAFSTSCSVTCGRGFARRSRTCNGVELPSPYCQGSVDDFRPCVLHDCPSADGAQWSEWGPWTCRVTCGLSNKRRTRNCITRRRALSTECPGRSWQGGICNRPSCPVPEVVGTKVYRFIRQRFTYAEAKTNCESRGGRLAVIRTEDIQTQLYTEMRTIPDVPQYFIGMTRRDIDAWHFIDGTRVPLPNQESAYQNWNEGEPNNFRGDNNCGIINLNNGRWSGYSCNKWSASICERNNS